MRDKIREALELLNTETVSKAQDILKELLEEESEFKLNEEGWRYKIEYGATCLLDKVYASGKISAKGHYQRTEELTLEVHKKHSYIATMTQLKDHYDRGWIVDWQDHNQDKYYFNYNNSRINKWEFECCRWLQRPAEVYFSKPFKEVLDYLNKHHPKGFEL